MERLDTIVISARTLARTTLDRFGQRDERGEGVISAAIAVLIVASIGAVAWVAFNTLFTNASTKAASKVNEIGG